ncbi:MAG TPA: zinc ribbon domain-containing protein, partial [Candidatus Acidoferrum sp.]|nr:zinc ribbon domain-containing protein [Candidatus Acidoferrum sp.]
IEESMADYQNRVSTSFGERMRLIRFRRKRERSSFREEFRIVPRWLVVTVVLLYVLAISIGIFVNLGYSLVIYSNPNYVAPHHEMWPYELRNNPVLASLAIAGTITAVALPLAAYLFLLGYVYRDAKRRAMHAGLWLLLILVLSPAYLAIGFLLYFFMREPLPYACPQCGAMVGARFNFCPNCKNNLHPACPQCKQEVAETDKFCPNCAYQLAPGAREESVAR